MEPSLHRDERQARQPSTDQLPGVGRDGRDGEVGDLAVGDRRVGVDGRRQPAEPRAEDQADLGSCFPLAANGGVGFGDLFEQTVHKGRPRRRRVRGFSRRG